MSDTFSSIRLSENSASFLDSFKKAIDERYQSVGTYSGVEVVIDKYMPDNIVMLTDGSGNVVGIIDLRKTE